MKTVVVVRDTWRSGSSGSREEDPTNMTGEGPTSLLNPQGYMCCLGFACLQLGGLSECLITGSVMPSDVGEEIPFLTERFVFNDEEPNYEFRDTELAQAAVEINDDNRLTREEREEKLTELFLEHDIRLEFKGEYEDGPERL